jgi:hypothetical protein
MASSAHEPVFSPSFFSPDFPAASGSSSNSSMTETVISYSQDLHFTVRPAS